MSQPKTRIEQDQFESACDEVIALCGGDPRAAVKALLVANAFLEKELALAKIAVSYGPWLQNISAPQKHTVLSIQQRDT